MFPNRKKMNKCRFGIFKRALCNVPYIGGIFFIQTRKKLSNIVLKYISCIVYKFGCGSYKAAYIGRTKWHLLTSIKEISLNQFSDRYQALSNNDFFLY